MRIENSPEYEAEMAARSRQRDEERSSRKREVELSRAALGGAWSSMDTCPFLALYELVITIIVSDGKRVAIAEVSRRLGRPIFYKIEPGEEDPRDDLPAWWWEWELTDIQGPMQYASGEEIGRAEVPLIATHWRFVPSPPTAESAQ